MNRVVRRPDGGLEEEQEGVFLNQPIANTLTKGGRAPNHHLVLVFSMR
jgi:hypothetical protein